MIRNHGLRRSMISVFAGRPRLGGLAAVGLVVPAFVLGFYARGGSEAPMAGDAVDAAVEPQQWYTCSMHPEVRLPDPDDKCPICFMALIPVEPNPSNGGVDGGDHVVVDLSPEAAALISVETVPAARRTLTRRVRLVGEVAFDQTRLSYVTAYAGGRLERMYVDSTGVEVREGDHLAEFYSPDLLVARRELAEARRAVDRPPGGAGQAARETATALLEAARERLRLLGLNERQVADAETEAQADGAGNDLVTLHAPVGGVVIEQHARPGSYVTEGERIYTLADLSRVWIRLEAYEQDLPWLRYGQPVDFTIAGLGDQIFHGRIAQIDPVLDPRTRTVDVRLSVDNADRRLRPGVLVRAEVLSQIGAGGVVETPDPAETWVCSMHPSVVHDGPGDCPVCGMDLVRSSSLPGISGAADMADVADGVPPLIVPRSAVLRTGRRGLVYVRIGDDAKPRFEPREVELGPVGEGSVVIDSGLEEGEPIAVRGNFQIDATLQLHGGPSMMNRGLLEASAPDGVPPTQTSPGAGPHAGH